MDRLYKAQNEDWGQSSGEEGDKSDEEEPIARVRRKFRNRGESVRAGARLLKTECGRECKTYQWTPAGGSTPWSEWEMVFSKKALGYFERNRQIYQVEEL